MLQISDTEVVVDDAAELATVVAAGSAYTHVYLGRDIQLTGGITIGANKSELTIDGQYGGVTHSITDFNSSNNADTLGVRTSSSIQITMKNMIINGHNYFGMPFVNDSFVDTSGVTLTYDHVTYVGPQFTYNKLGMARYLDCDITIRQNGTVQAQEVAEVNRVDLGGSTTIVHETTSAMFAVFWFDGDGATAALTVLEGAEVNITSVNNYLMYSRTALGLDTSPHITVQRGARLNVDANKGISYANNHYADSFTVESNASFRCIHRTINNGASTLYLNGPLTVEAGAIFYMEANIASSRPLIHFATAGNQIRITDPKSFVLYSATSNVLACSVAQANNFSISGGQLNIWLAASAMPGAGGFADEPSSKWNRADWSSFTITGTVASASTAVASTTFTAEELEDLPALALLTLHTAHVLSVGDLTIATPLAVDDGSPIFGWTEPGALVRATYDDGESHLVEGQANEGGRFRLEVEAPLTLGMSVTISANTPFLIATVTTLVIVAGEISIDFAPEFIEYATRPFSTDPLLLARADPSVPVTIVDNRAERTAWVLHASVLGQLQTEEGDVLVDAIVFKSGDSMESIVPLTDQPTAVHADEAGEVTTNVTWDADKGILVHVTGPIRNGIAYSARILWTLEQL